MRPKGLAAWMALSFLGGAAVMNGEIAAGRLLAPHLGTSTTTWAMLIGTVLGSLALGSLLGGWLSARGAASWWIVRLMLLSALLFAALPRVVPWVLASSLARFRAGSAASLGLLAALTALAIALPIGSLGAVPPLVMHAAGEADGVEAKGKLGRLAGRLSAMGTLGSLVGTFGAGLVLLPWLGTRATFDVAAVLLSGSAAVFGVRARARREAIVGVLASLLTVALAFAPLSTPAPAQGRLLWAGESLHNHIVVVERGGERQIRVNDGFAVQSFARLDGELPVRDVWAYYAMAPSYGTRPSPERVLLLGLGGGTSAEVFRRLYPAAAVVGVELDAAVVEAGRTWLGFDLPGASVIIDDARPFLEAEAQRAPGQKDVIVLDAFQFPYVPFQLATTEFFAAARRCLAPGGVLLVNAGRHGEERGVVHALARTMAQVFPHVQAADPPGRSNTILVATVHAPAEAVGVAGLSVSARTATVLRDLAGRHAPMQPASFPASTPVLTDDHAPVEWLTDRIIWRAL
ncbi:fused MFS/spermidine synthase [Polyangium sorediatum]|uniref:Fused MFS/spermidine synthase n=1 Tax=Polyangium sorediatum TaxID=889274 RepID=A0ABT6NWY1_9BACT|nr:fused MFS/spermidine synthase [Polyangium sorediatum]MDI1432632.1 fused MFS/spermidine synthase [Polyangium sorediatum]